MAGSILNRLKTEMTPLLDQDGATFVWRGKTAPYLVGDFTGWDDGNPIKLEKIKPGLWTYRLALPQDAYIEYGFLNGTETLMDPLNPRQISNGVGGTNNLFSMPDYKPTELARKAPQIPHGTVKDFSISTEYFISGNHRTIHLYQPPVTERVPLVVVWDGHEYLHRVRLNYIVDNLIAQGRIRPIALAFVNNGGQKSRTIEYACNEAMLVFLMTEVIPLAKKELNLVDIDSNPGEFGVCGASMGGLMAVYIGSRLPQVFGNVLTQSGAFSWAGFDMVVFDLLEYAEKRPLKIWMDVGMYDLPGLLVSNQRLRDLLIQNDYPLTYREYNAGHNYAAWRDEIWRGLEALYGIQK
jgi:enterochelin esterase family protein